MRFSATLKSASNSCMIHNLNQYSSLSFRSMQCMLTSCASLLNPYTKGAVMSNSFISLSVSSSAAAFQWGMDRPLGPHEFSAVLTLNISWKSSLVIVDATFGNGCPSGPSFFCLGPSGFALIPPDVLFSSLLL